MASRESQQHAAAAADGTRLGGLPRPHFTRTSTRNMPAEPTEQQSSDEQQLARRLSLQRTRPPTEVEGYQLQRFLGSGAYGEVWVGTDLRTGRKVAIKFYTHRGGVDWSLLSREVEKLVFLSADRYVVQLLDVGWDAEPPYYVMEFIEQGSLDAWLVENGPMPLASALELFQDVAIGLLHAHGRGVLHCDLKPANVLLDQDRKPRLADFGQSRLTSEQSPSLGTLFYMAPEQADLKAVPDARWDVYALGAMLYCTLTGDPPHRTPEAVQHIQEATDLSDRLARYRSIIQNAPRASEHRKVPGMDRPLIELIDRCLAVDPQERYGNIQAVLDDLAARQRQRARRPLMVLGFAGPLVLLLIMGLFALRGYHRAKTASDEALTQRAQEKNLFAAKAVAGRAAEEIQRYFRAVERAAQHPDLGRMVAQAQEPGSELETLLQQLRDPNRNNEPMEARDFLVAHPLRQPLQQLIESFMTDQRIPNASSWFVCDAYGTQVAAVFDYERASNTVGQNYGWRTYFHGEPDDWVQRGGEGRPAGSITYPLPDPTRHVREVHLSAPFQSKATNRWKVAVSTPVHHEGRIVGVLALTVDIGVFMQFDDSTPGFFAVLVDGRAGGREGMILQHPLFDQLQQDRLRLPDSFSRLRVRLDQFPNAVSAHYEDPLAEDELGTAYDKRWIAAIVPVILEELDTGKRAPQRKEGEDTGLKVIVQEDYATAVAPVQTLGQRLLREGVMALGVVVLVILAMWGIVLRAMREGHAALPRGNVQLDSTPFNFLTTVASPRAEEKA